MEKAKPAVIYCRTASRPQSRYDFSLTKQEDACASYAEKHGYEVLEIFSDSCTSKPPQTRIGFIAMCEFLRNAEKPITVLVRNYFSISRDPAEITEAFYLLKNVHGAEVCDIPAIDENLMLRRFKHEAKLQSVLIDVMGCLEEHEKRCAKLWKDISDITDEEEAIR